MAEITIYVPIDELVDCDSEDLAMMIATDGLIQEDLAEVVQRRDKFKDDFNIYDVECEVDPD